MREGALALRTGGVIAVSVALAVLLSVVLANLKFQRTLQDVTGSRLAVVVDDLRRHVEYGLTLGLDLAELADVQALVDRAAAGPGIEDVQVIDDRGTILFSGDHTAIGAAIGRRAPVAGVDPAIRMRVEGHSLRLESTVRNSFGQVVGTVAMRASLADLRNRIDQVERSLIPGTLALVAVAGLATLAVVYATIRRRGLSGSAPS